jgi:hypothetical protein
VGLLGGGFVYPLTRLYSKNMSISTVFEYGRRWGEGIAIPVTGIVPEDRDRGQTDRQRSTSIVVNTREFH